MSSSSGYVAIPRCPVIFDGANYPDFTAFMRVHCNIPRFYQIFGEFFLLLFCLRRLEIHRDLKLFESI
jgi:hypothetical protein